MIRDALGPSPLDENVRALAKILSSRSDPASRESRAVNWAVEAFKRAGADQVRTERLGPPPQTEDLVAEVRGRDYPKDYVLIAAQLDSSGTYPLATAENAAVLIDAVRVIHASGNLPRRSIRFVLFGTGAEASGGTSASLEGVWAYVRQHRAEIDRIAAAVVVDAAAGPADGYSLGNRPDMIANIRSALEPLRSLGIRDFTQGLSLRSEVTPFWLEGVLTLVATFQEDATGAGAHARADRNAGSLSPSELEQLKRGVAVAALTAYALADAESRIGPRQSHSQVQQAIQSLGIEPKLKSTGLWDEWQKMQAHTAPDTRKRGTSPH
ncbi:MAG: M28 family peptidase [Acidobacteriota bacterium]|nr:M28 family peptidase [Acidobacteriota bacterium]MDE3169054.1 M28 family peptidase [Acidobacteriota bacterium]